MLDLKVFLLTFVIALLLTVILTKRLIPVLRQRKIGQKILDIGPNWHKSKEGTPTMGGLAFIVASAVAFTLVLLIFWQEIEKREMALLVNIFAYGILNSLVGIIDDSSKLRKNENQGLTPKGKLFLQGIFAILFLVAMEHTVGIDTQIELPVIGSLDFGVFYYIISFFLLCGFVNAVNLTDGLDGLASTCTLTVGAFFAFTAFTLYESTSLGFFGAVLLGTSLGFLCFNLHPAKIFMGDTGSLFFGGIVVGGSFALECPLIVIIYGLIFLIEALSVILQVGFFKITKGKRLFKMAPLHHHFEKQGFSEMKIISIFGIASLLFCALAYLVLM